MVSGPDSKTVLHVSDMHFEDESVFGTNYESLETYREEVYDSLDRLAEGADIGWFSGDCGSGEDWERLDAFLDRFDDSVAIPGNSDERDDMAFYETGDVDEPEDVLANTETDRLDIEDGPMYEILRSHVPQHVGIPKGSDSERSEYLPEAGEREDGTKTGTREAADDAYDIVVTAHYHGEGSFVMEDGTLVLQAGSTADTYITDDGIDAMPDTSVQQVTYDDEEVHVEHIDLATEDVVEERGYRWTGDGFEETYREAPWSVDEKYGRS